MSNKLEQAVKIVLAELCKECPAKAHCDGRDPNCVESAIKIIEKGADK